MKSPSIIFFLMIITVTSTALTEFDNMDEAAIKKQQDTIHKLVNVERGKRKRQSLVMDEALNKVAMAHALDMEKRRFFNHKNPDGKSPFQRMKEAAIKYKAAAENIAGNSSPERAVYSWMRSYGHKRNILSGRYNKTGIGVSRSRRYGFYYVQVFTD